MIKKIINTLTWKRFFINLAILLGVSTVYIFWPIKVDLSHLEIPEGKYDVRILRDSFGVPHIFGISDADVAFGLAFAHSEDDFRTIQQSIIAAKGMMGQVYGIDSAAIDYLAALLRVQDTVDAFYHSDLEPETILILEAYAEGLNHFAALHPDEVLVPEAFPLDGKDMAAMSVFQSPMYFGLDGPISELFADERQSEVSEAPEGLYSASDYKYGSNVFAVGPSRTNDGSTFFAVNSHQPWEGPVTWYEAHLHSEDNWNVTGALFPGVPAIIQGHNENLSWAFTVNDPDLEDIYVLEINPENEDQYLFDGDWLDFEIRQIPIKVKIIGNLKITVKQEALWSVFGPTIRQDHGVYAIRYSGFGRVDIFQQLYQLNKSSNFEEWQKTMYTGALPTFNVGYADNQGNIFYLFNANLPIRAEGYDWKLYLPGTSSEVLWTDYLPAKDLPQLLNPPSGFYQNANSSPYSATFGEGNPSVEDYDSNFGIEEYETNRSLMLKDLFEKDQSITFEEFKEYKFNYEYHPESDVAKAMEMLARLKFDDPQLQAGQNLLENWDLSTGIESKETTLGLMTMIFLSENLEDFVGHMLAKNEFYTNDVYKAFKLAVDHVLEHFGKLDPAWGDVQRLRRGDVDVPLGGGPDIVRAAYSAIEDDGKMIAHDGDGFVMLIAWRFDGTLESYSIHQFGSATIREESPHYDDQSEMFANMELKPVWFTEEAILDNLEVEYTPWTSNYH